MIAPNKRDGAAWMMEDEERIRCHPGISWGMLRGAIK
jgi:hypothetical protein